MFMNLNATTEARMIDHDAILIGIGTLVTYEDMANPLQLGTVIDINRSEFGTQYRVAFHAQGYDQPSRIEWSDLRQNGWTIIDPDAVEES